MSHESWLFLILSLVSVAVQAFFSMMEMASVSFNKVRLQYYVSKRVKKALWLNSLLNHPTRLFGTTLIGINAALQFGSECARRFYSSVGLSPDWAPISQIIIVVIFAELSPIFAARSYAEHVALLGMRVLYFFSLVMRPLTWFMEVVFKAVHRLLKTNIRKHSFLSKEELQKTIEAREEKSAQSAHSELDDWVSSLFALKGKTAKDFMIPLSQVDMVPSSASVADVRVKMQKEYHHYFPVYKKEKSHVIGVISPRDLLKFSAHAQIEQGVKKPWFVPIKSSLFQIIREFRWNNQEIAMVVDEGGRAVGMITLDHTIAQVMPETNSEHVALKTSLDKTHILLDRSFPASFKLQDISEQYQISLSQLDPHHAQCTLEELMEKILKHPPGLGESIVVGDFELKVVHSPLIGEKFIALRSL